MVAQDKSIQEMDARLKELEAERDSNLSKIANILDPSVPISKDEKDNAVVHKHGECRMEEGLYHHHELLWMIDGYEPEVHHARDALLWLSAVAVPVSLFFFSDSQRGVAVAGHRAYYLKGAGVQLNQALINYGLAFLGARGYTPLQTPFFMNASVMAGVAQLSEFDETLYGVQSGEGEKKYLIATSEQPICAYHKDDWLGEKELPKR
jgi:seryl-tRNA synthetase